jgi:hypothetical protein
VTVVTIGKTSFTFGPDVAGPELNAGARAAGVQHEWPLTARHTL